MKENNDNSESIMGVSLKTQWIIGIIFVGLTSVLVHMCNLQEAKEIDINTGYAVGKITAIYRANWRSTVNYEFVVDGKKYESADSTPGVIRGCIVDKDCIGTTWKVEYSTENPNKSRLAEHK